MKAPNVSLSFVSLFLNLQEIKFVIESGIRIEGFKELQYVTFPKLQTLKIPHQCPKPEYLMKFLEINGKNLTEVYIMRVSCRDLNSSIAKFCPNLKRLFMIFNYNELYALETILDNCQYLECIITCCGKEEELSEKELLKAVANHSQENFSIL